MRKLKLIVDELKVESFTLTPPGEEAGTVHGRGEQNIDPVETYDDVCANTVGTCPGATSCCQVTWKPSCAHTCINTQCGNSCYTWWCNTCALDSCPNTCRGITCDIPCGSI